MSRSLIIDIIFTYARLMKWIAPFLLCVCASLCLGNEAQTLYDLKVSVQRNGERFQIKASYIAPISLCNAYSFLTDYEGAKSIPGIVESKVISRAGNKVQVERLIEERILLIPIEMYSVMQYTEISNQGLSFEQISGDAKFYKGSWRLSTDGGITLFKYESIFEPQSVIPNFVVEYFIKNSIRERFGLMAEKAAQRNVIPALACKS